MKKNIDFSSYSSIKIGPKVDVEIIDKPQNCSDYILIGGTNNLLISPNPPKLAMLSKKFDFIKEINSFLHIGATTASGKILSYAKRFDIANFELMQKLPGTMGGMTKMNAGLKEWEIFNHLVAIKTENGWIKKRDIDYRYRYTNIEGTIFEVKFEILKGFDYELLKMFKKLRDNQPLYPSAGSCFKNPKGSFAGKLLEDVGLKGFQIGDMAFSKEHANFLINLGNGDFEDAMNLINEAKKRVYEKFKIELELEIEVLGHQT